MQSQKNQKKQHNIILILRKWCDFNWALQGIATSSTSIYSIAMYCIQTYPMSAFASCTHCTLWDLWAFVACRNDLAVCFQIKISMRFYKSKGNIWKHELENHRELGFLLQWMSVTICHLPAPCVRSWLYYAWDLKDASLGLEGNFDTGNQKAFRFKEYVLLGPWHPWISCKISQIQQEPTLAERQQTPT